MDGINRTHLLRLRLSNFRSFGREQEISFSDDGLSTRKVTAIIGLNATGKSNIFRALSTIQYMVKNSANAGFVLPFDYFRFTRSYEEKPTSFELQFRYRDALFSYAISYDSTRIVSETLREKRDDSTRQRIIFERFQDRINPGAINFGFNRALLSRTRPNTLLVTKAIENNNEYALAVYSAVNSFYVLSCANGQLEGMAIHLLQKHPELIQETIKTLKKADFTIRDMRLDNVVIPTELLDKLNIPNDAKMAMRANPGVMMSVGHYLKDDFDNPILNNGMPTYAGISIDDESIGTRALLGIIVPIIDSIKKRRILFIDEFGAYLHYGLIQRVVNSYIHNKTAPGLIVCTHAGMMLDCIDRDSIYVLEKNSNNEESTIHKMSENGARLNERFSNGYYSNSRYRLLSHRVDDLF